MRSNFLLFFIIIFFSFLFDVSSFCQTRPNNIAGLQLWLKADSLVQTSGGFVTSWDDCSTNNYNAIPPSPANQPELITSALNSKPIIRFYGIDDFLDLDNSITVQTAFIVAKYNGGTTFQNYSCMASLANITRELFVGELGTTNIYDFAPSNAFGSGNIFVNNVATYNISPISNYKIFTGRNPSSAYSDFLKIGFGWGGYTYWNGDIAEIIIYDRALTEFERTQIELYLANKYGGKLDLGANIETSNFCNITLDAGGQFISYQWSTFETTQTIQIDTSGIYTVTVTDIFGYPSSDTISVTYPQLSLSDTFYCSGSSVTLSTGLSGSYTYNWTGGLTTPTINVNTTGYFGVTVTDGLGCSESSPLVYVDEDDFPFTASLGPDEPNLCSGNTIGLEAPIPLPTPLTYSWSTTENTPEIAISTSDTYTLTVTDGNGCSATDQIDVTIVGSAPSAYFIANTACSGSPTQFANTSSPSGTIWLWDFGDGQTSSLENPSHTYSSGGDYTVRHTVTSGGCSNYKDSIIHISSSPVPYFSNSNACINNPYSFYDQSSCSEGNIISWDWDFGDSTTHSIDTNALHTYTSAGIYNVELTVTSDSGCIASFSDSITVLLTGNAPSAFTLYIPSDSFVTTDHILNFAWNISLNAVGYKLQYSNDLSFSSDVYTYPNINTNFLQVNIALADQYYWRVIAFGLCGDSIMSNILTFSIFDKNTISGMTLWLMGDSVHCNGVLIDTLYDCSGNYNNAISLLPSEQPIQISSNNLLNYHSILEFNGTSQYLNSINSIAAKSAFIIAKYKGGSSFQNYSCLASLPSIEREFFVGQAGTQSIYNFPNYNLFGSNNIQINFITTYDFAPLNNYKILYGNNPSTSYTDYLKIGNGWGGYTFWNGCIAEIIIYNQSLSSNERHFIENYLHDKYAPPVNLGPDIWSTDFCDTTLDASDRFIQYVWSTGDPGDTLSTLVVNTGGTYSVTATDVFGFTSVDSVIVHKPVVTASSDTMCFGDSTTLHSGLTTPYLTGWAWAGDTTWNEAYTIHAGDTINLILADTSGCTAIRQIIMAEDNFPTLDLFAGLNPNTCTGDIISLDTANIDTTLIATYSWFDGTTYYNTPTFTIPSSWTTGPHNLQLTCTNARGCSVTDNITLSIQGQQPVASFNYTTGCHGIDPVYFDDTSVPVGTGVIITDWYWNYGNGDLDTLSNSSQYSYIYANDGIYNVTLTVESNQGCKKSITQQVPVYSVPVPVFSPLLGCTGVPLNLSDHSISAVGDVTSWSWNFNDPNTAGVDTSTLAAPSHTYDSSGYYTVHMVVETEYGCIDSIDKQIFIRPSPNVDFSYTSVCDGNAVYFTNETEDELGIINMYWDFGNDNILTSYNPIFTFDAAGTYPVTLVVQSINGCTVNYTENVVVHAMPVAVFTPSDDICLGGADTLIESSTVASPDSITQWEWDFGELGTFYGQYPVINFPEEGNYTVTLTVSSNAGCSDNTTATLQVNPAPSADFQPSEYYGTPPFTVNFTNYSSSDAVTSYWEFDDGTNSALSDPVHTFGVQDTFNVMLVVANSAGCTDTTWEEIYSIPTTADVAVTNVTTEQSGDFITVSADIWNLGQRKIYELYLYAKASGGTEFMETWSDFNAPLEHGDFLPYTFDAQFSIPSEQDLDYICVEAQIQNYIPDDDPGNNEECITYSNSFSAFIPYPSPSHDEIDIDYILPFNDQVKIDLYDVRGRLVRHIYEGEANKGLNKLSVDISDLALAVYVYRITFNEDFRILRFVKY